MKRVLSIVIASALFMGMFVSPLSAATAKEWTLAVFLNADNNLDPFGVEDQKEMAKVGSSDFLNIVTLIDRERSGAEIDYIEKGKINKVKDMGELDMGDYKELVSFAKYVKQNYPAKKYCFVLWNHGSGWKNKNENSVFRGISYDDSSNNHITNDQLTAATSQMKTALGQDVDVMVMDACLMQMVEVNHAIKDNVKFMVGSEEVEPGKGAPYTDILKKVKAGMTASDFAVNWVSGFAGSYNGGSQGSSACTQSATDLSKFSAFMSSIDGLAKALMSGKYSTEVKAAVRATQSFEYPENISLLHFTANLKAKLPSNTSIKTACEKVETAAKAVIIANKTVGSECKNAKGIAIYLPSNFRVDPKYKALAFSKASMWDDMIAYLAKASVSASITSDAAAGDLSSLKKFVKQAKGSNSDAALNRAVVRELNFAAYSDNKIPESVKEEFDSLLNELKSVNR